jgi:hypothetical protein
VAALATLAAGPALATWGADPASSLHRRPRPRNPHRSAGPTDREYFVNLKFGKFEPESSEGGPFFGLSSGVEFQDRVAVGFNLDVYRRSFTDQTIIAETIDPTGIVINTTLRSLETSANLIPLGVSLAVRLPGSRTLTPYVGVGAAYEILLNDIENFELGIADTNVYTGLGWQAYGGLLLPITREVRMLGELWYNDATVERDIDRFVRGLPVREEIDVDGFGARVGVEFHFDAP